MTTPATAHEAFSRRSRAFQPHPDAGERAHLEPAPGKDDAKHDDEAYWSKIYERATD